ncbi:unnamed protein product [Lactuca saligna]|uniref:PATROL1-like C-terminal domain-containing protein n=1 Tax=Lactuca saligna TaxID=75948 RepID=A0AA36DZ04_LACSI|nr:unnamed protein product [Lactuca saligna]
MICLDPEKESNEGEDVVVFLCLIDFSPFAPTHSSHQKLCCPHSLIYQIPITPPSSIHQFSSPSATVLLYRCFLDVPVTNTGGRRRRWIGGTIPSAYTYGYEPHTKWLRTQSGYESIPDDSRIVNRYGVKIVPNRKDPISPTDQRMTTVVFRGRPISMQQRHGSLIVEVYRIIEETVDQFFALKIPMRSGEMNSLFRGINNALQVYSKHVVDNLRKESFDGSRKDINAAIDRICEFTGTKIIFWDLREPFIENLYRPSVSESRLETTLIEPLDVEPTQLCDIIVEPLRDRIELKDFVPAAIDALEEVIND